MCAGTITEIYNFFNQLIQTAACNLQQQASPITNLFDESVTSSNLSRVVVTCKQQSTNSNIYKLSDVALKTAKVTLLCHGSAARGTPS
jgi:hypothetical protein